MRSLNVTWTRKIAKDEREREREDNEVFVALPSSLPSLDEGGGAIFLALGSSFGERKSVMENDCN